MANNHNLYAWEKTTARDEMLFRGRDLYKFLERVDDHDERQIEDILLNKFSGDNFNYDCDALAFYQQEQEKQQVQTNVSAEKNKRLSVLIDQYLLEKSSRNGKWTKKTHKKYHEFLNVMLRLIGDIESQQLTYEILLEHYVNNIFKRVKNIHNIKILHNSDGSLKSEKEILEIADMYDLERISTKTAIDYCGRVKSFLLWGQKRKHFDSDLMLAFEDITAVKDDDSNTERYTFDDLSKIFISNEFETGEWHYKYVFRHWGMLLALYTGARAGEICQIHIEDIKKSIDGVWYISLVDEDENRRLKTKASKRDVVIHKHLIELGFLKYVDHIKDKGHKQLFKDCKPDEYGIWHRKLTDWFRKYKNQKGIVASKGKKKVFHSFRHTFIDQCKQQGIDERITIEVVGHEGLKSTHRLYQKKYDLKTVRMNINKINFGLDLKMIKKWK